MLSKDEFQVIEHIKNSTPGNLIGDDCAVIPFDVKNNMLVSTDILIENIHFSMKYFSIEDIIIKSINSNISDICAMAGVPKYIFVSGGIPEKLSEKNILTLTDCIIRQCEKYNIILAGGDTSSSENGLIINITIIGYAEKNKTLFRSTAVPGDLIFLTNYTGLSALGFNILNGKKKNKSSLDFINAHLHPPVLIKEAALIGNYANSLIDISDGLSSEINHICKSSGVGAMVYYDRIPKHKGLLAYCTKNNIDSDDLILNGGEDYQLLGTCAECRFDKLKNKLENQTDSYIFNIGTIIKDKEVLLQKQNERYKFYSKGYKHFE